MLGVGFAGLAATWFLGLSHGHASGTGNAHTALAHRGGYGSALAHKGSVPAQLHGPGGATAGAKLAVRGEVRGAEESSSLAPVDPGERTSRFLSSALRVLSPLTLFGLLFGAGAAGALCSVLGAGILASSFAAVGGAVAMRWVVISSISNLVFRFASRPAQNLEGCLFQEVHAVTRFNKRGEGLVRVNIDGHVEDVLAKLTELDRGQLGRVRRGERLVIEEVDTRKNRCVVSRA
jgi:hypothetical protein